MLPRWLRRRMQQATPDTKSTSAGGYIWYLEGRSIRVFLLGTEALHLVQDDEAYSTMMVRIGRLADPDFELGDKEVMAFPHYVRIKLLAGRVTARQNDLTREILAAIADYLGYEQLPVLGTIRTYGEYQELNKRHGDRWQLGGFRT